MVWLQSGGLAGAGGGRRNAGKKGNPRRAAEGIREMGIRDSPLRCTKTHKDKKRRASAIRSELLMTSLLSGALQTDSEFSLYPPLFALAGLSTTKGFHTIPISRISSAARLGFPFFPAVLWLAEEFYVKGEGISEKALRF